VPLGIIDVTPAPEAIFAEREGIGQ
jgi:two-component system sensor histidine kinase MtrB